MSASILYQPRNWDGYMYRLIFYRWEVNGEHSRLADGGDHEFFDSNLGDMEDHVRRLREQGCQQVRLMRRRPSPLWEDVAVGGLREQPCACT